MSHDTNYPAESVLILQKKKKKKKSCSNPNSCLRWNYQARLGFLRSQEYKLLISIVKRLLTNEFHLALNAQFQRLLFVHLYASLSDSLLFLDHSLNSYPFTCIKTFVNILPYFHSQNTIEFLVKYVVVHQQSFASMCTMYTNIFDLWCNNLYQ